MGNDSWRRLKPRHVIVDRDGVLNEESESGWVVRADQWHWLAGATDALSLLTRHGLRVSVVTNQSCVGRGIATLDAVNEVHQRMIDEARATGGSIAAVFVCAHAPDEGCDCRKPRPDLVRRAIAATAIPVTETIMIGDDTRDILAARTAGVDSILVRTGKGKRAEVAMVGEGVPVFDDLLAAAKALLEA